MVNFVKVTKRYGDRGAPRAILSDFTLAIPEGERLSLIGANGSGKTTILRLILGIESPDQGAVESVTDGRVIAYVPQDYRNALFPWLSLRHNLDLLTSTTEVQDGELLFLQMRELCATVNIELDFNKYPYQFSGGEQQIFVLLRALLSRPHLLLLDEPLAAVDYARRIMIHEFLGQWLASNSTSIILATHDFEEAVLLTNQVVVLDNATGRAKKAIPVDLPWPRSRAPLREQMASIVQDVVTAFI